MVRLKQFLKFVRLTYDKALGKNICLLVVGGSVGRGNYIQGWSDADLLLVLRDIDSKSLRLIRRCEDRVSRRFGIETDTMITSKFTIERIDLKKLHGKVKNFLFFLAEEKVLIQRNLRLQKMDNIGFKYGFWATYVEQEKNFLRRNADANAEDLRALQALLKKNIKIIFLIIKRCFATSVLVPSTYKEAISLVEETLPAYLVKNLKKYETMRLNSQISEMSALQLKKELSKSVEMFTKLGKIVVELFMN